MKNLFLMLSAVVVFSAPVLAITGQAEVKGTVKGSKVSGMVLFEEVQGGLRIRATLSGIPAGEHAFHIHEFGSCGDEGKEAGSHYNPLSAPHGHILKDGVGRAHAGDLGNIMVGADGKATMETIIPTLTLLGPSFPVAGRAVIVHDKKDDFGQPVGNAGGRIGCGSIVVTGLAFTPTTPAASK